MNDLIKKILIEWSFRLDDGMINLHNSKHMIVLIEVLKDMDLPEKVIVEVIKNITTKKLKYNDCITKDTPSAKANYNKINDPLSSLVGDITSVKWKQIYKGFKEYILPINDNDSIKLIKMEPGTSVPLHSHNGKEYILVLEGSFSDEYGEYKKGDMQINDQKIKHHPTACNSNGCVCLSITENDGVFFGKFGSLLNLFTFIKSFFK